MAATIPNDKPVPQPDFLKNGINETDKLIPIIIVAALSWILVR